MRSKALGFRGPSIRVQPTPPRYQPAPTYQAAQPYQPASLPPPAPPSTRTDMSLSTALLKREYAQRYENPRPQSEPSAPARTPPPVHTLVPVIVSGQPQSIGAIIPDPSAQAPIRLGPPVRY